MLYGRENLVFKSHQFCLVHMGHLKGEVKRKENALQGVGEVEGEVCVAQ